MKHRVSFYEDDVVLFLKPSLDDLQTIKLLGHASGLRTNLAKSSATPILCSEHDLAPQRSFPVQSRSSLAVISVSHSLSKSLLNLSYCLWWIKLQTTFQVGSLL